jgi:hypothetical protein
MARSRSPTRERDKAKDLLKEGKDPNTAKQFDKHRQAAARPFDKTIAYIVRTNGLD